MDDDVELFTGADAPFELVVDDELERYRAETLRTKEPETIAWIDTFGPRDVFYDIGANIGIYSLYAASRSADLRVVAVEAYYKNWYHLVQNVLANRAMNVTPLAMALGGRPGTTTLHVPDVRFGASGAQIDAAIDERGSAFTPLETVPTLLCTVDELSRGLGLPAPTHVKIDVDGAELAIVEGMAATIEDPTLQSILVEVNPERSEVAELEAHLDAHGFRRDERINGLAEHSRVRRAGRAAAVENIVYARGV